MPPSSPVGFLVVTLTAPPVVLRPNSVPCGPRSTSMRSRSATSNTAPTVLLMKTPSMYRPTFGSASSEVSPWPTPRMAMFMFEFEEGCFWIDDVGREVADLRDVEHAEIVELVGGERGDRDRGVLQGFLAALGRDDDFLQTAGPFASWAEAGRAMPPVAAMARASALARNRGPDA